MQGGRATEEQASLLLGEGAEPEHIGKAAQSVGSAKLQPACVTPISLAARERLRPATDRARGVRDGVDEMARIPIEIVSGRRVRSAADSHIRPEKIVTRRRVGWVRPIPIDAEPPHEPPLVARAD